MVVGSLALVGSLPAPESAASPWTPLGRRYPSKELHHLRVHRRRKGLHLTPELVHFTHTRFILHLLFEAGQAFEHGSKLLHQLFPMSRHFLCLAAEVFLERRRVSRGGAVVVDDVAQLATTDNLLWAQSEPARLVLTYAR